jgi:hypothetical protein
MTLAAALARPNNPPRAIPREVEIARQPNVRETALKGIADFKAGRVKPWLEVKKELDL